MCWFNFKKSATKLNEFLSFFGTKNVGEPKGKWYLSRIPLSTNALICHDMSCFNLCRKLKGRENIYGQSFFNLIWTRNKSHLPYSSSSPNEITSLYLTKKFNMISFSTLIFYSNWTRHSYNSFLRLLPLAWCLLFADIWWTLDLVKVEKYPIIVCFW